MKKIIFAIVVVFIGLSLLIADIAEREGDKFVLSIKEVSAQVEQIEKSIEAWKAYIYVPVEVSAYNPTVGQCDSDPYTMASNKRVFEGAIALSRDLEEDYGLRFGKQVYLLGIDKIDINNFEFQDRMGLYSRKLKRHIKRSVDIFMWSKKEAVQFGRQKAVMVIKG